MGAPPDAETPLERRLKERIARDGPIPFSEFMRAALYDPNDGYYARGPRIGPEGDFSTSVRFPAFRRAIARLAVHCYHALGKPRPFRIVELGAGTGQLAREVISEWHRALPDARLDYATVDASDALRLRQEEVPGVTAHASPSDLPPAPGLVFGNEVLDALPVHRVVGGSQGLLEIHVDLDARSGRLRERLLPLSNPTIEAHLHGLDVFPARGQVIEVALGLGGFVRDAARLPEPGFLVFVDYGDEARALYAPTNMNGTLAAYRAHGRFHEPLARVGEQDLTADVDFTTVAAAATQAGMESLGLATQQTFLEGLGIAELGLPDEVHLVSGAAGLGTAFHVAAFRRGTRATLPGFP